MRNLPRLALAALLLATTPLAGCGLLPPTSPANVAQDLTTLQSDASTTIAGLQGILPALVALGPQYASAVANIQKDLGTAASYLPTLNGFSNIKDATSTAQAITTALSDALKLAASLPIPQPYAGAVMAANVLLPVILNEAGLPAPASAKAPNYGVTLTPDQARRNLRLAAQGKL